MKAENPTLLIAGAGDLGQRVAHLTLQDDWNVLALRRHPPDNDATGIEWIEAELGSGQDLRLAHRPISHVVYALAPDERQATAYEKTFVQGLQHLIQELNPDCLERFIFVSSTAVYAPSTEVLDENSPTEPTGFNGKILLQAEQLLNELLPAQAISLRLSGLYGPDRLKLLDRLKAGTAYAPSDPEHYGNRIHIEDATRAIWHLLNKEAPFPCYIGTDSTPYPLAKMYDKLAKWLDAPSPARKDYPEGGKRFSNQRLINSGFEFAYPDSLKAYRELIEANKSA